MLDHNDKADASKAVKTLGGDLRALRKARGLTLQELSRVVHRSVGWLSQVERDITAPGIEDLRLLAATLDVSVSSLFRADAVDPADADYIVRKGDRRPIGSREAGLVEELLSPDLTDDFEVVHSVFEPGAALARAVSRPTQEVAYIISGALTLWIGDRHFELMAGDSFRIRGEPFRWANTSTQPCTAIWVIAPPVY